MRLDHVILACPGDLEAGAQALVRRGLPTVAGGRHPAFGTANRLLPLGRRSYLELAAVVDPELARRAGYGRLLRRAAAGASRSVPAAWCVAVDDLPARAARLGLELSPGSREQPDGTVLRWATAGIDEARATPYLPFFISWEVPPAAHPSAVAYTGPSVGLVEVRLSGDPGRLATWLGGALEDATVVIAHGPAAIRAFVLDVDGRTIVLDAG